MKGRPRRGWCVPVASAAAFGSVATLSLQLWHGAGRDVVMLLVVPVAALGRRYGWHGALVGLVPALGVLAVWATVAGPGVGVVGVLIRAAVFVAAGSGALATSHGHLEPADDSRWFEMCNDMIAEVSLEGYFTRVSERWEQCLGWTREELMARPFREFVHPDDLSKTNRFADALDASPGEVVNFENRYLTKDGSWRWLSWSARSDHVRKYAVARDVTAYKDLEAQRQELLRRVEEQALTDPLTGLPNRRAWDNELERAVATAFRTGRPLVAAMVDLDGFKAFNDAAGHLTGDRLLADAAQAWQAQLRVSDFIARYGGEEFAVLLPGCGPGQAEQLLDRLRRATPDGQTCSIGVAELRPGESSAALLMRADEALYGAKRAGRDRVIVAGGC